MLGDGDNLKSAGGGGGDLESFLCEKRRLMALEFHAPMSNKLPNKGMLETWNIYEISSR